MEQIILVIKGILVGIGKIIPGVSGSVIAISLNVYERGIDALSNFFTNIRENFKFLFFSGIGVLFSIVIFSKLIKDLLTNYYLFTMFFFIGMIIGSSTILRNKIKNQFTVKNVMVYLITFIIMISLMMINNNNDSIIETNFIYFIVGFIDAATMIIPGISGTAVMMLLGLYNVVLRLFANFLNISLIILNIKNILMYLIGLITGALMFVKIVNFCIKNHTTKTYFAINAFRDASVIIMIIEIFQYKYLFKDILIATALFIIGYKMTHIFSNTS